MPHRCRLHVESYKRVNALSCLRRLTIKGHVDSTVVVRCIKRQMKRLHSIATWSHSRERTRPASRLFNLFSLGSFKCGRERRAEKKEPFDQFILSVPRARRCRFCGVSVGCCHLRVTYIYIYMTARRMCSNVRFGFVHLVYRISIMPVRYVTNM